MSMNRILLIVFCILTASSCVISKKKYEELAQRKSLLELDKDELIKLSDSLQTVLAITNQSLINCDSNVIRLATDTSNYGVRYSDLADDYKKLENISDKDARNLSKQLKKVSLLMEAVDAQNKQLEAEKKNISSLNKNLEKREGKIDKLKEDLNDREKRVKELESLIAQKEASVKAMRKKISKALLGFNQDELTVNVKDGKIYVSLEEQLLFKSGSYSIDTKGNQALSKLAGALAQNPDDFTIMVEGHTDDVPYRGSGVIKDNWDLSVLRATSIVKVLVSNKINPKKVVASGRGEHLPKVSGDSKEAKSKNRRIEIIIIPNIDELLQLLEE